MITALYAALLGIFFTVLTLRVLALRGVTPLKWLAFNNFGAQALERAVRAHGNFIEYVPMVLLMMYFAEAAELSPLRVHITGGLLLLGRIMHGIQPSRLRAAAPLPSTSTRLSLLRDMHCLARRPAFYYTVLQPRTPCAYQAEYVLP